MYRLKSSIEDMGIERQVNADIRVQDNAVYLTRSSIQYKYQYGNWYQFTDRWVNLQGGVPVYEVKENIDDKLFEEVNYVN